MLAGWGQTKIRIQARVQTGEIPNCSPLLTLPKFLLTLPNFQALLKSRTPPKTLVKRRSAPVWSDFVGGDLQMLPIKPVTSWSNRKSKKRMGTPHRSPSSLAERLHDLYPEGFVEGSRST